MPSTLSRFRNWFRHELHADVFAAGVLLSLSALYAWLTWLRCNPVYDHGWYMQVAARVAAGEVLYRDVSWIYGPLPVYLLGLLYRLFRVDVATFSLLGQVLATLACLLTYRVARFLLSAPWALLGTVTVFLSWRWGGFLSYILGYAGATSLGAVLGLLFVSCLLSHLKSKRVVWLIGAGVATGGAFLAKPEFGLVCAGTGVLFLGWIVLFPAGLVSRRGRGVRAVAVYVATAAIPAGIGYGVLAYQAGGDHIWAGLTSYGQTAFLLRYYAPWGTPQSWCYIVSGLGVHLLTAVALVGSSLAPAMTRKHLLLLSALALLCLALIVLPWGLLPLLAPERLSAITASKFILLGEAITVIHAPGTLLLSVLVIALGFRWFKAHRRKQAISQVEWFYAVLVAYSLLAAARFYFNPILTLFHQYVNTLFPVFVFSLANLVPRAMEQWGHTGLRRSRTYILLAVILSAYAVIGFTWDVRYLSNLNTELTTPRGTVFMPEKQRLEAETLRYIISHTDPEDAIVVLDFAPGFYFLSGRKNPLRQDCIIAGIGDSPAEANEIVQRLETHQPQFVIIPQWTEETKTIMPLQAPRTGREHYENLMPVWQYVHDRYQVRAVIGEVPLAYNVYAPLNLPP